MHNHPIAYFHILSIPEAIFQDKVFTYISELNIWRQHLLLQNVFQFVYIDVSSVGHSIQSPSMKISISNVEKRCKLQN